MRRINSLLKDLELQKANLQKGGYHLGVERIDPVIAERQARYDHLAGVPGRGQA